jgi:hypothetical protein
VGIRVLKGILPMMIILDSVNVLSLTLHGHPDFWEIVQDSTGVYVECTKCGVDLVHLLPEDWEKHAKKIDHPDPDELAPKVRENKHDHMNAHLHADGTTGYYDRCNDYCKESVKKPEKK